MSGCPALQRVQEAAAEAATIPIIDLILPSPLSVPPTPCLSGSPKGFLLAGAAGALASLLLGAEVRCSLALAQGGG